VRLLALILVFLVLPSVHATLMDDVILVQHKVDTFLNEDEEEALIVHGKYESLAEKSALAYLREEYPEIAGTPHTKETLVTELPRKSILIGGPNQNTITARILDDPAYTFNQDNVSFGTVMYFTSNTSRVLVFSDYAGFHNLPRTGIDRSPLARIVPREYVPIIATIIGFTLLWFWQLISKLFFRIAKFIVASKILDRLRKRALSRKYIGFHVKGVRFKLREWICIALAAIVFSASLSYMFLSPRISVFAFLFMTAVVNLLVYAIRHVTRLVMDTHHRLHTEYTVWYWGIIVTALTGWLGNTFALAGYIVNHEDKGTKYEGKIAFVVNLLTFVAFLVFWAWNLFDPGVMIQMGMLLSLSLSFLQMLPMKPFAGPRIRRWSRTAWWLMFVPLLVFYILINLVV